MRAFRGTIGLCLLVILALPGCDLPRDPEHSLQQIRQGVLRAGVIENPPWVMMNEDGPGGVEPALLRALAAELGARVAWVRGSEQALMQALEHRALHVVIGGITDTNPWAKQLGPTKPFHESTLLVAARPGAPPLSELKDAEVAAPMGSAAAGLLMSKQARPTDPRQTDWQYIALPDWRTASTNLTATQHVLRKDKHVMLVSKGENAWLVTLERFLDAQRPKVEALLREHAHADP